MQTRSNDDAKGDTMLAASIILFPSKNGSRTLLAGLFRQHFFSLIRYE